MQKRSVLLLKTLFYCSIVNYYMNDVLVLTEEKNFRTSRAIPFKRMPLGYYRVEGK